MVVLFGNVSYYTVICNHMRRDKRYIKSLNNKKCINFLNNITMSKNSPLIINFKRKSTLAPKDQSIQPSKAKKRRGPKKWLNKDLTFKVDPKNAKYFPITKTSNLIPLNKKHKIKPYKVIYCDRNGDGLLKTSKMSLPNRRA